MSYFLKIALFFLSGAIVAFGQPAWIPWLAPVIAVCGYALFWRFAEQVFSAKKRFFLAWAWFALVQLVQLSWMTSIEYQGFYILFVYGILALGLGAQFGLLTLLASRIPLIATAALWTLLEWVRLFVLCGFSWNPVGLTLTAFPLPAQAASIFGILGLSFWVILTNLACWKKRWKAAATLALCPYLFGALQWSFHHSKMEKSPHLQVALVQTALLPSQKMYFSQRAEDFFSPHEQWSRICALLSRVKEPVDLVVLPEAAVPYTNDDLFYSKQAAVQTLRSSFGNRVEEPVGIERVSNRFWIESLANLLQADVIVGLDAKEGKNYFASAFFYSWKTAEMSRYDKQILLPLVEYLPFEFLKRLTGIYGITEFFSYGKGAVIFQSKVPISASICYEDTFGHVMRLGRQKQASLFVNITNDNWFPSSRLPKQHFDLAKVRAIENGIPLIRACNSGITSTIDSLGRIVAELDHGDQPDVLIAQVPLYQMATLYTLWGDMGIIVISIIFLLLCLVVNRRSLTTACFEN